MTETANGISSTTQRYKIADCPSREASRAAAILRAKWQSDPPQREWVAPLGTDFPGLAEETTAQPPAFEAFERLERWQRSSAYSQDELAPRLMLVPCTHEELA